VVANAAGRAQFGTKERQNQATNCAVVRVSSTAENSGHSRTKTSFGSHPALEDEGSYICDGCGEEIVVPLDLSAGDRQEYVEDCPVCCRPNVIHVEFEDDGSVRVWAAAES
jgi:hypothetical protein